MITDFSIQDFGLEHTQCFPGIGTAYTGYDFCDYGVGTDAESALDDLLECMATTGYDVSGLEGRIKSEWDPDQEEGAGESYLYHLGLLWNEDCDAQAN
jgi:hypothetical protein